MTPEQRCEFDLRGYIVLHEHYDAIVVQEFHAGIDELQAIPVEYEAYWKLGVSSYYLAAANGDLDHPVWKGTHREERPLNPQTGGVFRVDHAL